MAKKFVFISHPLSGDMPGNMDKVREICRVHCSDEIIPFASHIYFTQFVDSGRPEERERCIEHNLHILSFCDELWVFGDRISEGMEREIEFAKKAGIPIVFKNQQA